MEEDRLIVSSTSTEHRLRYAGCPSFRGCFLKGLVKGQIASFPDKLPGSVKLCVGILSDPRIKVDVMIFIWCDEMRHFPEASESVASASSSKTGEWIHRSPDGRRTMVDLVPIRTPRNVIISPLTTQMSGPIGSNLLKFADARQRVTFARRAEFSAATSI